MPKKIRFKSQKRKFQEIFLSGQIRLSHYKKLAFFFRIFRNRIDITLYPCYNCNSFIYQL